MDEDDPCVVIKVSWWVPPLLSLLMIPVRLKLLPEGGEWFYPFQYFIQRHGLKPLPRDHTPPGPPPTCEEIAAVVDPLGCKRSGEWGKQTPTRDTDPRPVNLDELEPDDDFPPPPPIDIIDKGFGGPDTQLRRCQRCGQWMDATPPNGPPPPPTTEPHGPDHREDYANRRPRRPGEAEAAR